MSPKPEQADWERYKQALRELWIQKGMTTNSIMDHMQDRYKFTASKNDYDRHFKAWGWKKKLTPEDWFLVKQDVEKRKREHDKESEVRFNGEIVDIHQKTKKNRLKCLDEIRLSKQAVGRIPEEILICTPGNFINEIQKDNIPWINFYKSAAPLFRELVFAKFRTPVTSLTSVQKDESRDKNLQMITIFEYETELEPEIGALRDLIYSVANNLRYNEFYGEKKRTDIAHCFDILEKQSTGLISHVLDYLEGPTGQTFLTALVSEAFQRDDTRIAIQMLPRIKFNINSKIRALRTHRISAADLGVDVAYLAELVKSARIARIFAKHGGNLSIARKPFLRLISLDLDHQQLEEMYGLFIEAQHEDVCLYFGEILKTGNPSLISKAMDCNLLPLQQLANGIVTMKARQLTAFKWTYEKRLGQGWLSRYGPTTLAYAAWHGLEDEVAWLIGRGVALNDIADLRLTTNSGCREVKGASALQLAIERGEASITAALLAAGSGIAVSAVSTLPPPINHFQETNPSFVSKVVHEMLDQFDPSSAIGSDSEWICSMRGIFGSDVSIPAHLLTLAAASGDLALVDQLISLGCEINPTPSADFDNVALLSSISSGQDVMVRRLLHLGARMVFEHCGEPLGSCNLLVEAIWQGKVGLLEDYVSEGNIDAVSTLWNGFSVSPLMAALGMRYDGEVNKEKHDHALGLRLIKEMGAAVTKEPHGISPLTVALMAECSDCIDLLRQEGAVLGEGDIVLLAACCRSWWDSDHLAHRFWEGLHYQHCGTSVHYSGECSCSTEALISHKAAGYMIEGLIDDLSDSTYSELKEKILSCKLWSADIDWAAPCVGGKALEFVSRHGDVDLLLRLLEVGVKLRPMAFHTLAPCCQSWISERKKPTGRYYPLGPLEEAIDRGRRDLVCAFVEHGADPNEARLFTSLSTVDSCIDRNHTGKRPKGVRWSETTPFLTAAGIGDVDTIRVLIDHGADVHRPARGYLGRTALQETVEHGKTGARRLLLNDHAVSVNEPPARDGGVTALQAAAMMGRVDVALELIEAGAVVDAARAEIEGYTALEMAAKFGRLDMVQLLINAGADIGYTELGTEQFERAVEYAREGGFPWVAQLLEEERQRLHGGNANHMDEQDYINWIAEQPFEAIWSEEELQGADWDLIGPPY